MYAIYILLMKINIPVPFFHDPDLTWLFQLDMFDKKFQSIIIGDLSGNFQEGKFPDKCSSSTYVGTCIQMYPALNVGLRCYKSLNVHTSRITKINK
jgi:hypothetical protein